MSLMSRDDSLSVADKERIDQICLAFEDAWLAGQRPVIEQHLRQATGTQEAALLGQLVQLDVDYRRSLREEPTVEDYAARFPRYGAEVRQALELALQRGAPLLYETLQEQNVDSRLIIYDGNHISSFMQACGYGPPS